MGVRQLHFLNRLVKGFDREVDGLRGRLAGVRQTVFRRGRLRVNMTGDDACLRALRAELPGLIQALPAGGEPAPAVLPVGPARTLGVTVPGKVCFVARVIPAPRYKDPAAPALLTLTNYLSDDILYKKIRVEGGAYGGSALYNTNFGALIFVSYRDPNLERTLETYDRCLDEFLQEELEAEAVRKTVIGTVADLDRPMAPGVRGFIAFERLLVGIDDADRQRFREAVLATGPEELRRAARETVLPALGRARQAVLAPKDRLEAANMELGGIFEIESAE